MNPIKYSLFIVCVCLSAVLAAFYLVSVDEIAEPAKPLASYKNLSLPVEPLQLSDATPANTGATVVSGLEEVNEGDLSQRFVKHALTGDALRDDAPEWACVHDVRSGLLWEVKADDASWRDSEQTYTWFRPIEADDSTNEGIESKDRSGLADGGSCLFIECDTASYLQKAREERVCSHSAWRLPSESELKTLDHPTRYSPDIYTEYFPYTQAAEYWSASESDFDSDLAWSVDFANGIGYVSKKSLRKHVRLVMDYPL